jgi:hypothetical protein
MPATVVKAVDKYSTKGKFTIFLGGQIDMGKSLDWQKIISDALSEYDNLLILNPRRDDWDSSWKQEASNPQFSQQVNWELAAQVKADLIVYVFGSDEETAKTAKCPITLLEYGLFAASNKVLLCVPDPFYRKGNLEIVAEHYGTPMYDNLDELIEAVKSNITKTN